MCYEISAELFVKHATDDTRECKRRARKEENCEKLCALANSPDMTKSHCTGEKIRGLGEKLAEAVSHTYI